MATNPYLGAAMMLAAGLEGIEQQLDPGDPIPHNMYLQTDERAATPSASPPCRARCSRRSRPSMPTR